jgi:serine/threonine-protein kinase
VLDTLDQVRSQEPVPPSRLQRRVPRDLETICLKCLQKSPQRRYPRALLLAEDLQAYLHGRPIQARPVSTVERVRKWVWRHPGWAACIGLSVLAVVSLVVGLSLWATASSAAAQREASLRLDTENSLDEALAAVETMLTKVGDVDLADVPQLEGVRKTLLLDAQEFYERFLKKRSDSAKIRFLAGRAEGRLGDIHDMLDEHTAAERSYLEARELLEGGLAASVQQRQTELARVCNNLGVMLKRLGRYPEAQKSLKQALDLRQKVLEESPNDLEYRQALAKTWYDLATVLARLAKQRAPAEEAYREALKIQEALCVQHEDANLQRDRAQTLNNLGILLEDADAKMAEEAFVEAVKIYENIVKKYPNAPGYSRQLARSYSNLAAARRKAGQVDRAEAVYGQSIKLLKRMAADFPTVPVYRQDLAGTYFNLGLLFQVRKRFDETDKAFDEALRWRRQVADESPKVPDYQDTLANLYREIGQALVRRGLLPEADQHYQQAILLLQKIATADGRPDYQSDLALALDYRGELFLKLSKVFDALQRLELLFQSASGMPWFPKVPVAGRQCLSNAEGCLRRAVSLQRNAWTADKRNLAYAHKLYNHYQNLSIVQVMLNDHQGLAESARGFPETDPNSAASYVVAANRLSRAVAIVGKDMSLTAALRHDAAERYAQAAIAMLRDGLRRGFSKAQLQELKTSPVYAPLRKRPEFRTIIGESEERAPRNA